MADQPSQESTLQAVLEQLKTSNAGDEEIKNETQEVVKAVRKQRSDVGKHHNWNKKHGAEQSKVGKWMVGYFVYERALNYICLGDPFSAKGPWKMMGIEIPRSNAFDWAVAGIGLGLIILSNSLTLL